MAMSVISMTISHHDPVSHRQDTVTEANVSNEDELTVWTFPNSNPIPYIVEPIRKHQFGSKKSKIILPHLGTASLVHGSDLLHTGKASLQTGTNEEEHVDRKLPPLVKSQQHVRPVTHEVFPDSHTHSSILGTLHNGRVAHATETMLPRLRAGGSVHFVPSDKILSKSGLYALIDRGFLPADGDYSKLLSSDAREQDDGQESDATVSPFVKFDQATIHEPREKHEGPRQLPAGGLYEPTLRLAPNEKSGADKRRAVNNSHVRHLLNIRPSLRPRPTFDLLPSTESTVKSIPLTPAQSHVISPHGEGSVSGSSMDLFKVEAQRAATARMIAASREGPVIIIQFGKVQRHAPSFLEFRRKVKDGWDAVEYILEKFERFTQEYAVPYAEIMCKKIVGFATPPMKIHLTRYDMLDSIVNSAEVYGIISSFGQRYRGIDGVNAAASKIQATYRMWVMRRIHLWYLDRWWAASVFIKYWKRKKIRRGIKQTIEAQYRDVHLKRYQRLVATLKRDKAVVMGHKRTLVQLVPSKHLGDVGEIGIDISIGRALCLADPDVQTIFVTPYVDEDRIEYFKQLIEPGFPDNNPMENNRIRFVVPEAARCFPRTAPLASMLLSSKRALAEVKRICQGRNSVLVCDVVGEAEVSLSSTLSIPILGTTPEAYSRYLSTRARARQFLRDAGIPVAPALESHAKDEYELCLQVIKAISMFSEVPLWTLYRDPVMRVWQENDGEKPDACIDPTTLTFVQDLYEPAQHSVTEAHPPLSRPTSSQAPHNPAIAKTIISAGYLRPLTAPPVSQLRPKTPRRGMIATHLPLARHEIPAQARVLTQGRTWRDLVRNWSKGGVGLLMGFPSRDARDVKVIEIGVNVDFEGKWELMVMAQVLLNRNTFSPTALVIPNSSPALQVELCPMLDCLARRCASHGIVGIITVQFLTWKDKQTNTQKFWATHLLPHLTPTLLRASTVLLATGCRPDQATWKMRFMRNDIPLHVRFAKGARYMDQALFKRSFNAKRLPTISSVESRCALYIYALEHGQVAEMKRAAAVASAVNAGARYDIWTRTGMLYPEKDSTWAGAFPVVCVARDYETLLEESLVSLLRLNKLFDECAEESSTIYRNNFMAVVTRLLYEWQSCKSFRTKTADRSSIHLPPAVRNALDELNVASIGSRSSRSSTVRTRPRISDAGRKLDPSSDDDVSLGSDLQLEMPDADATLRAPSAAPTVACDLELLLSHFMTLPAISSRPSTVSSARSRARTARRKKRKHRRGAFSSKTAALLAEIVPSDEAAKHDETFWEPVFSPPYTRQPSAQPKKGDARSKRARAMLERMEKEMEEQGVKEGVAIDEDTLRPLMKGRQRRLVDAARRPVLSSASLRKAVTNDTAKPVTSIQPPEPVEPDAGQATISEEQGQPTNEAELTNEGENQKVVDQSESTETTQTAMRLREGSVAVRPQQEPLDMDTVLMKLKDMAEHTERLSAIMDEKNKMNRKILEEGHRTHLKSLEQRDSATTTQEAVQQPPSLRPARSVPSLVVDMPGSKSSGMERRSHHLQHPDQKAEPNRLGAPRVSDLVHNILGDIFTTQRRNSIAQRLHMPAAALEKAKR